MKYLSWGFHYPEITGGCRDIRDQCVEPLCLILALALACIYTKAEGLPATRLARTGPKLKPCDMWDVRLTLSDNFGDHLFIVGHAASF